jgi:DNA invertase Pin-like site-specific DNA recombinase
MNNTTTETKSNLAVVYLRSGSCDQADIRNGLGSQQRICEDFARKCGLHVTRIYADAGVSGLANRRPSLDRMLSDLSSRRTPYVIVADPARLARNQTLSLALELQLGRYGTRLILACAADRSYIKKSKSPKRRIAMSQNQTRADQADNDAELQEVAAIYARVSSSGQLGRGDDEDGDGYSIPAQVKACEREAEARGATVIKAYIERAESARSDDRPVLQQMMRELPVLGVRYLIVHKVDRLARNRLDDAQLYERLVGMNIRLVSASENIDETPAGRLMHGMLATFAEYYSNNLASEIKKGCARSTKTAAHRSSHPLATCPSARSSPTRTSAPSSLTRSAPPSFRKPSTCTPPATGRPALWPSTSSSAGCAADPLPGCPRGRCATDRHPRNAAQPLLHRRGRLSRGAGGTRSPQAARGPGHLRPGASAAVGALGRR